MRWIVGLLLVCAATLKSIEFLGNPSVALYNPIERWFLPLQISVEFGVGILVLSGVYWQQLRRIAILIFGALTLYTLHLARTGAADCGCFGPIKVNPWWTLLLDSTVLLALIVSELRNAPKIEKTSHMPPPNWLRGKAVTATATGVSVLSATILVCLVATTTFSADQGVTTVGHVTVLDPERWIGKPLPIADAIDLNLSNGDWTVLIHRHDCPDCQVVVPKYQELARLRRVALVEVPPYGQTPMIPASGTAYRARLSSNREWFVETPVEIELSRGVVTSVSSELPALISSAGK